MARTRDKPIQPTAIFERVYFAAKLPAHCDWNIISKPLQFGYKPFPLVDNNLFTTYY
jgi:hypothetical protein